MENLSKKNINEIKGGESYCLCAITKINKSYTEEAMELKSKMPGNAFLEKFQRLSDSSFPIEGKWVDTKEECREYCRSSMPATIPGLRSFEYDHHYIEFY